MLLQIRYGRTQSWNGFPCPSNKAVALAAKQASNDPRFVAMIYGERPRFSIDDEFFRAMTDGTNPVLGFQFVVLAT